MRKEPKSSVGNKCISPLLASLVVKNEEKKEYSCPRELLVQDDESDKKRLTKETKLALKKLSKMSNEELDFLLNSDDDFVVDCILDSVPAINKLKRERDSIAKQVGDLAKFNYAREPEFVRDRLELREALDDVSLLSRRLTTRHILPIIDKLKRAQEKISQETRHHEEESERVAQEFLEGKRNFEDFLASYIDVRKEASRRRFIADRLSKEGNKLGGIILNPTTSYSPVPMPRRKRVSLQP